MGTELTQKIDDRDCEDASVDIPKKNFRSRFTWALYEATRSYEPLMIVGWFGSLLFCFRNAVSASHHICIVGIAVVSIIWAPVICLICRKKRAENLVSRNNMALAEATKDFFSSEQETLAFGWDKVASQLNRKYYIEGDWKTPHCIFDGAECESYFRRYVLKPTHEEETQEGCEKSCLHAAVSIYQQKVLDQFNRDKEDTSVLAEDNLPADSHRNKFTWRWKNFSILPIGVCVLQFSYALFFGTWTLRLIYMMDVILMLAVISTGYSLRLSTTENRIRLLATIANVAPGEDTNRWDVVAKRINAYMNEDSNVTGVQRFFDGKDCLRFFEKELKPLISKKIKEDGVATYELVPLVSEVIGGAM